MHDNDKRVTVIANLCYIATVHSGNCYVGYATSHFKLNNQVELLLTVTYVHVRI